LLIIKLEHEFARIALETHGESEFLKSAWFRRENVSRISTIVAVAGQIFITFICDLTSQNEAIDAHRRHDVWSTFYVAERGPLQTPITASIARLRWHIYERNKSL